VGNERLLLRPGMTATVSVQVRKAQGTLRIPAAALRFRPEGFEMPRRAAEGSSGALAGATGVAQAAGAPQGAGAPGARRAGQGRPGGGGGAARGPGGGGGGWRGAESAAGGGGDEMRRGRPTTIFVAGPDGQPKAVPVTVGISDGQFVELREGLDEGAIVITGTEIPGAPRSAAPRPGASPSASSPFSPQFQRRQR
jgi:hypothetical protein